MAPSSDRLRWWRLARGIGRLGVDHRHHHRKKRGDDDVSRQADGSGSPLPPTRPRRRRGATSRSPSRRSASPRRHRGARPVRGPPARPELRGYGQRQLGDRVLSCASRLPNGSGRRPACARSSPVADSGGVGSQAAGQRVPPGSLIAPSFPRPERIHEPRARRQDQEGEDRCSIPSASTSRKTGSTPTRSPPARRAALPMTAPARAAAAQLDPPPRRAAGGLRGDRPLSPPARARAGRGRDRLLQGEPARGARRFAEGCGRLAKTDRIAQDARCQRDAEMLARMGAALALEAQVPTPQNLCELKDLLTARRALARDLARERTRTPTSALLRRLARARERLLLGQIATLDAEIAARIAADPGLARARRSFAPFPASGRSPPPSSSSTCPSSAASAGPRPRAWPASPRSPGSRASPTARRTSAAAARTCAARSTCRRWWPCAATQTSRSRRSAWPPAESLRRSSSPA